MVRSDFPCACEGDAGPRPGRRGAVLLHDKEVLFSAARADGAMRHLLALCEEAGHELQADAYVLEEAIRGWQCTRASRRRQNRTRPFGRQ